MEIYAFVLCFFQSSKCLGLLVFSRFLTFDRLAQLLEIVAHVFPFCSLQTLENGLTNGMPVLVHRRRPHIHCHPSVVSMKVRNIPSSSCRASAHERPPRTTASGKSVVKFGFTTGLDSIFFATSPTFTASWLSTMMNLLRPFIILSQRFNRRPCATTTGLSLFFW